MNSALPADDEFSEPKVVATRRAERESGVGSRRGKLVSEVRVAKRVTSSDVAKAAGVSRTTVSFVLNDVPTQSIPEGTKAAVLRAAEELGYIPSAAATALRTGGTSRLILCLAPAWEPALIMDESLNVLTRELRALGFATVVAKAAEDPASLEILWRTVSPSAIVAMFDLPTPVRERIARMQIPLVEMYFHSYDGHAAFDDVQRTTGRLQATHLLDQGADELIYLYPEGLREPAIPMDRLEGVRAAANGRGVDVQVFAIPLGRGNPARPEIRDMLNTPTTRRRGVCAYNDLLAVAVVSECQQLGIAVPNDVLVIGVDDDPVTEAMSPSLSTIRFSAENHMRRIAHLVAVNLGLAEDTVLEAGPAAEVIAREST